MRALLLFVLFSLPPGYATACPNLNPAAERRLEAQFEETLLTADRVIQGRWIAGQTSADSETVDGRIAYRRNGKPTTVQAIADTSVNMCGLLRGLVLDGNEGVFYLRRISRSTYGVIHFEPKDDPTRRRALRRP